MIGVTVADSLSMEEILVTPTDNPVAQGGERRTPTPEDFRAMQNDPDFLELKRRLRSFVFPMAVAFLTWYFVYLILGTYAHDFMAREVFGNINLGIVLGLGQFVTTFLITAIYVRFANRELDPRAESIRARLEGVDQ